MNYRGFLEAKPFLEHYLFELASPTPQEFRRWTKEEQLAFWINAYNAFTVKIILDHYPIQSIKKIPGVWDRFTFDAAGQRVTLNQVEHFILRAEFKEPRIHMAIVCASIGCPPLRSEAYMASELNAQLDDNATQFFKDPLKARWDPKKKMLFLSPIFSWFREDFGSPREFFLFVKRYLPPEIAHQIEEGKTHVRFLFYDWSLNE
ncbi:MAG: DUF547 domain-containing protein [Candidatus Omnitrophica bacterium]|nr:DUF547 domain-containing protein [Candidatus Omnitrophota bacterium]